LPALLGDDAARIGHGPLACLLLLAAICGTSDAERKDNLRPGTS
jgi:hypothetical protein